jgi:hypothetical protein
MAASVLPFSMFDLPDTAVYTVYDSTLAGCSEVRGVVVTNDASSAGAIYVRIDPPDNQGGSLAAPGATGWRLVAVGASTAFTAGTPNQAIKKIYASAVSTAKVNAEQTA